MHGKLTSAALPAALDLRCSQVYAVKEADGVHMALCERVEIDGEAVAGASSSDPATFAELRLLVPSRGPATDEKLWYFYRADAKECKVRQRRTRGYVLQRMASAERLKDSSQYVLNRLEVLGCTVRQHERPRRAAGAAAVAEAAPGDGGSEGSDEEEKEDSDGKAKENAGQADMFSVERVMRTRLNAETKAMEFQVKWRGYEGRAGTSWITADAANPELLKELEELGAAAQLGKPLASEFVRYDGLRNRVTTKRQLAMAKE